MSGMLLIPKVKILWGVSVVVGAAVIFSYLVCSPAAITWTITNKVEGLGMFQKKCGAPGVMIDRASRILFSPKQGREAGISTSRLPQVKRRGVVVRVVQANGETAHFLEGRLASYADPLLEVCNEGKCARVDLAGEEVSFGLREFLVVTGLGEDINGYPIKIAKISREELSLDDWVQVGRRDGKTIVTKVVNVYGGEARELEGLEPDDVLKLEEELKNVGLIPEEPR